jgi:hypothetical protein
MRLEKAMHPLKLLSLISLCLSLQGSADAQPDTEKCEKGLTLKVIKLDDRIVSYVCNLTRVAVFCTGSVKGLTKSGKVLTNTGSRIYEAGRRGPAIIVTTFMNDPFIDGNSDLICE